MPLAHAEFIGDSGRVRRRRAVLGISASDTVSLLSYVELYAQPVSRKLNARPTARKARRQPQRG
jgi:hypothetical protein